MKVLAENKKAYFNYAILEKFEAGIVLTGNEVKAIKAGKMTIAGSYAVIKNKELWLVGASVPPYQPKNAPPNYNPDASRKLLLTKDEIKYLVGKKRERLTFLPTKVYNKKGRIKIELALAKFRKTRDKREALKKKEARKEIESTIKGKK